MEIASLIITGLKTIVGAIYPPLKRKFFDQPKIYIRLIGTGYTFIPQSANVDLYQHPENMLNRLQVVDAKWQRQLTLLNNSEHVAFTLKFVTQLDQKYFSIEPDVDNFKPLLTNSEIAYSLIFSDTFERREREASVDHPVPKHITDFKLILEYTNVKGTKFFTVFDNSLPEEYRNKFSRKI
ncbi:MAG: hypothetical protein ABIP35_15020 [Ginsengibacter sp.]